MSDFPEFHFEEEVSTHNNGYHNYDQEHEVHDSLYDTIGPGHNGPQYSNELDEYHHEDQHLEDGPTFELHLGDTTLEKDWNVDIHGAASQFTSGQGTNSTQAAVGEDMCNVCLKRVYPMERFTVNMRLYHKNCFRCNKCKRLLGVDFAVHNGHPYCKPHFLETFRMTGRYDQDAPAEMITHSETATTDEPPTDVPAPEQTKKLLAKFRELESTNKNSGIAYPVTSLAARTPVRRNQLKESVFAQQQKQQGSLTEQDEQEEEAVAELVSSVTLSNQSVQEEDSTSTATTKSGILETEMPPPAITANLAAKWKAMENKAAMAPTPTTSEFLQKKARESSGVNANVRMPHPHTQQCVTSPNSCSGEHFPFPGSQSSTSPQQTDTGTNSPTPPVGSDVVRNEIGEVRDEEMPQAGTTRSLLARFQHPSQ